MNPSTGENQPQIEFAAPKVEEQGAKSQEQSITSSPENKPQKQSVQASSQAASDLALPAQPLASDQPAPQQDEGAIPSNTKTGDRIEKEWIEKAKTVIAKTLDDPYEQKRAMSEVKADYIKKRFNKTVKTDGPVK